MESRRYDKQPNQLDNNSYTPVDDVACFEKA